MTDETSSEQPQHPQDEVGAKQTAAKPSNGAKSNTKAILTGVGIGSAALVAALMYATKRPKRRG